MAFVVGFDVDVGLVVLDELLLLFEPLLVNVPPLVDVVPLFDAIGPLPFCLGVRAFILVSSVCVI